MHRTTALVTTSALVLALGACGSAGTSGGDEDSVSVVTSFYPLEFAAEQVGGEHVTVTNLTPTGAEPHDLELSPQQVLSVREADELVYLAGFQPSVDDAAKGAGDAAFDVTSAARLTASHDEEGSGDEDGHEDGHEGGVGHDHGGKDPHFWLDPTRYADVADALAERLASDDPAHAEDYRANADAFTAELTALDQELTRDLSDCVETDLVTAHAAFGYFAERYGFHQVAVSGLSPDSQPSSRAMADLIAHITDAGISTIYTEPLLPPDLAETIARNSRAEVATLDPIEGVTEESVGSDYFEIMRSNRDAVAAGQGCR